jgi:hypothetical protein
MSADSHWVWKTRGDYLFTAICPVKKFIPFSIMVWGAIGVGFKSSLLIFESHVNSDTYSKTLEECFIQEANEKFGIKEWVLVQDGATCHTSERTITRLCEQCIVCQEWPPNSPDLNPIEMMWGIMKHQLNMGGIRYREQAIFEIRRLWNSIPQESVDRLCASFPTRIEMMKDADGQTIQPLLANHRTTVPENYFPDRPPLVPTPLWNDEEDHRLMELFLQIGPKWQEISWNFPGHNKDQVMRRWAAFRIQNLNNQ